MAKLKVNKNTLTIDDDGLAKIIAGTKGNIKVKTPFGERLIKAVKNKKGKILKR